MLKSESAKFRNNLDYFLHIKMITPETHKALMAKDLAYEQRKAIDKPVYMAWIAINPPPLTISMEDLYTFTKNNLPYDNYIMSVEQNTVNGLRPHIHALAECRATTRPKVEISRLAKLYKLQDNFIEYKVSRNRKLNISRQNYIRGEKTDSKLLLVEKDIKDRLSLNILNYYLNGII